MFNSLCVFNAGPPADGAPDPPDPSRYHGTSALAALVAWWDAQDGLKALFSGSGALIHVEAPETTAEPYATVVLAAESERPGRTTAGAILDTVLQISVHAETDAEAVDLLQSVRAAVRTARLSVRNQPVGYVLPGSQTTGLGEGLGLAGRDCWVATLDVEIAHSIDCD